MGDHPMFAFWDSKADSAISMATGAADWGVPILSKLAAKATAVASFEDIGAKSLKLAKNSVVGLRSVRQLVLRRPILCKLRSYDVHKSTAPRCRRTRQYSRAPPSCVRTMCTDRAKLADLLRPLPFLVQGISICY